MRLRVFFAINHRANAIKATVRELETANNPQTLPKKYVLEARKKLGNVVTRQFSEWMLTGSETEVGWLL